MTLSIITTSFNSVRTIEDTIKSVLGQIGVEIEYIIIDGGSTDGTLEIIKNLQGETLNKGVVMKVISEPDDGMYDAMNKGIKLATGDIMGILNSDDFYASTEVLKMVADRFAKEKVDCVWGDLVMVDSKDSSSQVRTWQSSNYEAGLFQKGWHPPHPTFFVKREIYEKFGYFRTDFSTAADYELQLRFLEKNKISSAYIPETLVKMRQGGVSNKSFYNLIRANWYCYKAFKINSLKISPAIILKKPLFKFEQYFKKCKSDIINIWILIRRPQTIFIYIKSVFYTLLNKIIYFKNKNANRKYYLSILAIFKQENPWLVEWIEYHKAIGVEHFYLYNNDTNTMESDKILEPYVKMGIVSNIHMPGLKKQSDAYRDGIILANRKTKWLAIVDLDEFIYPIEVDSLGEILQKYESYGGLVLNWYCFGSSGHINRPESQINDFLYRAEKTFSANKHIKTIVRPDLVKINKIVNPHSFSYINKYYSVDENFKRVDGPFNEVTGEKIRLNHILIKSLQDFIEIKMTRGRADTFKGDRGMDFFKENDKNNVFDDGLSKKYKKIMAKKDNNYIS